MSTFLKEWQNLSIKIRALREASNCLFSSLRINSSGADEPMADIYRDCKNNFRLIIKFKENYSASLSEDALKYVGIFLEDSSLKQVLEDKSTYSGDMLRQQTTKLLIKLISLESTLTYYLGDTEVIIRKTVEVAFSHLQRLIVVDEFQRKKWEQGEKEVDYEKLGGVHLLWHKIWAFKANSVGERTDLILSEAVNPKDALFQSVDGLVLTEWKVAKNQNDLQNKIDNALEQASRYNRGSLAPLELSNYCYLVMVSKDHLEIDKSTILKDGVTYRIINIAYSPEPPSKS